MKTIIILSLMLSCCGTEPEPREIIPQDPPRCLNCGMDYTEEEIEIPEPRPRVYVTPIELLFYYDQNSERPYPPGYIRVVNKSGGSVIIINAVILEDADCYICSGINTFSLSNPELPQILEQDESLQLEVSFSFSTTQQGAVLEVYTTYEPDSILQAKLSGKVFIF